MLHIDLVYVQEDAATAAVRNHLRDALHLLELPPRWDEWQAADAEIPAYARGTAIPTVFVNGQRVPDGGASPTRARIMMAVQEHVARR